MLIDTHAHLYLKNFSTDIDKVISDAKASGVEKIILPNIDENSVKSMLDLCSDYPKNLFPAIGLHPTSVKKNYQEQIDIIFKDFNHEFCAIGEIGMDLYWDKSLQHEQKEAFRLQLDISVEKKLPIIIHSRNSMAEIIEIIDEYNTPVRGVFHCFSGDYKQAKKVMDKGFLIGVGGVLTYKNSNLREVIQNVPLNNIVLETDSPFLPPQPYRGKRNQPSLLIFIAQKIALIQSVEVQEVARITSENAIRCFKI